MIGSIIWCNWLNFRRDRIALALTFVLPIVFFSIFAIIFGNQRDPASAVRLTVVDEDQSRASKRLMQALKTEKSLRLSDKQPATKAEAEKMVREGAVPVAVIIPKGFGEDFGDFVRPVEVELLQDKSDPIAAQVVAGMLQKTAITGLTDVMLGRGFELFEENIAPFTPEQMGRIRAGLQNFREWGVIPQESNIDPRYDTGSPSTAATTSPSDSADPDQSADVASAAENFQGLISVNVVDVLGDVAMNKTPMVSYNAAGSGVMFLLFMASASAGALLEEREKGTLERLLGTRLGMTRLLAGKWLFTLFIGWVQLFIMFVWGSLVFQLILWRPERVLAVVALSFVTAAAASGFGLLMATLCKTRAQQAGVSTIVVLMLSALGGSMIPRFIMADWMQTLGLITPNAWALDGFQQIFWRDRNVFDILPNLGVLAGAAVAMLIASRLLARRWEQA
jgi:ABC-2 type transport system permease protein